MLKAKIIVMPRESILEPQGIALKNFISSNGHNIKSTNVGKCIELIIDHNDFAKAKMEAQEIAEKYLVNGLIETFSFDILQI